MRFSQLINRQTDSIWTYRAAERLIRSVNGNLPNILSCFTAHTNAVRAVLPAGLGRGHRANPAASLKIEKIYGTPVLLSGLTTGLSSLVLSKAEITCLSTHYKTCLEGLMKLYPRTPAPVVAFLSGSLPASALLHIDQFSLFGMISRQDDSPLKRLAYSTLSSSPIPPKSWFKQISDLSQQYSLPSPLTLLTSPLTKEHYKRLIKSAVTNYWELTRAALKNW